MRQIHFVYRNSFQLSSTRPRFGSAFYVSPTLRELRNRLGQRCLHPETAEAPVSNQSMLGHCTVANSH